MKSLWNAKIGLSSIIVYFVSEKKDEAKQIVRNYIIFAQSQVGDQKRMNFIWQNDQGKVLFLYWQCLKIQKRSGS